MMSRWFLKAHLETLSVGSSADPLVHQLHCALPVSSFQAVFLCRGKGGCQVDWVCGQWEDW